MDKLVIQERDKDGFTSVSDLTWRNMIIPTKNIFPLIRSTQPNELDLLLYEKTKNNFKHVDGCVIKLVHAPKLLVPEIERSANQGTIDGKESQSMFSKFRRSNFIIPDPPSDYIFKFKENYDNKLLDAFPDIDPIKNYVEMYRKNKQNVGSASFKKIRKYLYDDLWLDYNQTSKKEASRMLEQILNKERKYYGYGVPLVPVCTEEIQYIEKAKNVNEASQAIAFSIDMECATNFVFTKNALKSDEIMAKYFDYIRANRWATLNMVKFIGFDMHDLDLDARYKYFQFMSEIAEIKEQNPKKAFMLLEGGHQGYLSMQVFDIVSHSLTGVDEDTTGFGKYSVGNWYDERLMITRPPHLAIKFVSKEHCPICNTISEKDFSSPVLRIKRRKHMLYDLDKRASAISEAVKAKCVKSHMTRTLINSEFSAFQEYLLNQ